jgi:hypothetical protein
VPSAVSKMASAASSVLNTVCEDLKDVPCLMCQKVMRGQRSVSSLVSHAKRHYHVKQYACPMDACAYTSAESTHVRAHLRTKHKRTDLHPVDNKNTDLQSAWMHTTTKCFPTVATYMHKYRFKTSMSPNVVVPPSNGTGCAEADSATSNGVIR